MCSMHFNKVVQSLWKCGYFITIGMIVISPEKLFQLESLNEEKKNRQEGKVKTKDKEEGPHRLFYSLIDSSS